MKTQTVQEIENHPHYTPDFKYFMLRRSGATGGNGNIQNDDGLTLATLCHMVLGEEAADRSNDALVRAVSEIKSDIATMAQSFLKVQNEFIAERRGKENASLREELSVTDKILVERTRVLEAIPPCNFHGSLCIPHALDWIAERRKPTAPDNL